MAASIRATSVILFRSKHSSASVSRIHPRNVFAGIRTLPVPGTQLYKRKGERSCPLRMSSTISSFKSRTMVTSSSEENHNNEDFRELEKWRRGGGLFHTSADIDATAFIESGAIVHAHAKVGPKGHLGSGSVVGPYVSVGSSTRIGYNVSLQNCSVGDFCIIHNGVCIGQDGFGHFVDEQGNMVKKPQLLYVKIGNHVEIGANTCIDRGSWRDTVIGDYTKIDNLVQIGHNVVIGRYCILCGQVGIAGSVTMGDYVVLAGKSSVADHVSIASKARVAALGTVTKNIVEPGDYAGFPAVPAQNWRRSVITLRRLSERDNS